jgi:tRNA(fMet)-specific endonuclease VapC
MIAFDTDVLTEILRGNTIYAALAAAIPRNDQWVPIVVAEEIFRGRLQAIRHAEVRRGAVPIDRAYELFREAIYDFRRFQILSHTPAAESLYHSWRAHKIRVPTHDLRIAAICAAHGATLISRNRRDFDLVPGLLVEYW